MQAIFLVCFFLALLILVGLAKNAFSNFISKDYACIDGEYLKRVTPFSTQKFLISQISHIDLTFTSSLTQPYVNVKAKIDGIEYSDLIPVEKVPGSKALFSYNYQHYFERLDIVRELITRNPKIVVNEDLRYYIQNHSLPDRYNDGLRAFGIQVLHWG